MILGSQFARHVKTERLEVTPITPSTQESANGQPKSRVPSPHGEAAPNLMSQSPKLTRSPQQAFPQMLKVESLEPMEKTMLPPRNAERQNSTHLRTKVRAPGKAERPNLERRRHHRGQPEVPIKNNECGESIAIKATTPRTPTIGAILTLAKWSGCSEPHVWVLSDCLFENCTQDGGMLLSTP